MAERVDWTKLLVPRVNRNADGYTADFAPDSLTTTDLVSLLSVTEAQQLPFPDATDFAHLADGEVKRKVNLLLTRTPGAYGVVDCLDDSGLVSEQYLDQTHLGAAPSISLRLPPHYTLSQLAKQFGLTKTKNGLYQVSVGEYPQTAIANLGDDVKRCTGRWFTTLVQTAHGFVSRQHPEYLIHDQRYVLVPSNATWYKVEPLTWWVTNSVAVANGTAKQLDLTCTHMIMGSVPFSQQSAPNTYAALWQNSLMRAWLNSADSRTLDGNPAAKPTDSYWDFTQGGFLQQALNLTREPTREYTIPSGEREIVQEAFSYCAGLEKLVLPSHVNRIGSMPFEHCANLRVQIELPRNQELNIHSLAMLLSDFKYLYLPRDPHGRWLWVTPEQEPTLTDDYYPIEFEIQRLKNLLDDNYRSNFIQIQNWRQQGKIKFMPPEFTLATFPASAMANYFVNNNHKRWAELVKTVHFDLLDDQEEKINSLTDLMKIYYALGGFSAHQGERDQAFNYVVQHVARYTPNKNRPSSLNQIGIARTVADDVHQRFSRLVLKGPHNPTFAQFFMKYYHTNPDFMRFAYGDQDEQDYLCAAHNSFAELLQKYPNRVVNGNTVRNLLTPQFVAEHCSVIKYENVVAGNEDLAAMVGRYGYTPEQFDQMQTIYQQAKAIKDCAVIHAEPTAAKSDVSFRVLAKDDPLGFVIGDITNCCQTLGGIAASCVIDGYTNPNAGFLVWETAARDADGTPTGETRILAQAYVWYDPQTKTICFDNIEIPTKVINELKRCENNLSLAGLLANVVLAADSIMTAMNRRGTPVERVTVGKGYNDLQAIITDNYCETDELAVHRNYSGYSDAKQQYLLRTYTVAKTNHKLSRNILRKQSNWLLTEREI